MSDIIFELPKNSRERIVLQLGEFNSHRFVDLRVYVIGNDGGPDIPTKKGLAVPLHLYPQFRAALAKVDAELVAQGLLDEEDLTEAV